MITTTGQLIHKMPTTKSELKYLTASESYTAFHYGDVIIKLLFYKSTGPEMKLASI